MTSFINNVNIELDTSSDNFYKLLLETIQKKSLDIVKIKHKVYNSIVFLESISNAFEFENINDTKIILTNWNKVIKNEVAWGKKHGIILEKCCSLGLMPLKEIIQLIQMSNITKNIFKMTPTIGLTFSLGILHAMPSGAFENTGSYLTIEEIYKIIPEEKQSKKGFRKFREDFLIKGTSNEINTIFRPKLPPVPPILLVHKIHKLI